MWKILVVALGLVLVLEGIFPFVVPKRYKETLSFLQRLSDQRLRIIGAIALFLGCSIILLMQYYFNL